MIQEIRELIADTIQELFDLEADFSIDRPEEQFGDYSTNAALKIAKELNKAPAEIAGLIADKLKTSPLFSSVNVAGPGFINLFLTDQKLIELASSQPAKSFNAQIAVVEYSDPNPFKILHGGHLYTSVIGEAIANLLEVSGAKVYRVNFGGDVGLHVAKCLWAVLQDLGGENPDKLEGIAEDKRSEWLSEFYVRGSEAYDNDPQAKTEIQALNKRIYEVSLSKDKGSALGKIYWTTREWSYAAFDDFYKHLGIDFVKYYPESEVSELGLKTVKEHIPEVYSESQGAVIFAGEKYGLHTNVFINSEGLPTYAAKDVGLAFQKWQDYHYDRSIIITDKGQSDYLSVVLKSIEQYAPELTRTTTHLAHGLIKLAGGQKMSSRKGNILKATDILDLADKASQDKGYSNDPKVTMAAVKYAFVKQRLGGDIVYNPKESVSLEGNSGPYLQYAFARAKSILTKAGSQGQLSLASELNDDEKSLVRALGIYPEIVEQAVSELLPHHIATYLYTLAQNFNHFYEHNRVISDERQELRLGLIRLYCDRLASGLGLLGIEVLDKM